MADILENPVDLIGDAYEQEIQVEQEMIEVVAYRSYNRLDDKPQINGVELVGNKTSSDLGITAQIESAVNSETQARAQADNTLQGKIDTEKLARQQADSTLQGNIDAEETARKAADKDIQDVLDGETLARQNADTALGGRIDTEIHDRQVADIALQGQIDAITSKSDVVDVVANYVALQAYDTSSLGNNDVIKVLDDETHEDALTYYRWSTTTQTWTYIGQEAPYYSKSQTDTLLLGKQNTIDSSHKLSADLVDDTSTTNKFVTAQDKTNWNGKQDALTAGTGIDITGDVISTPAIVPEVVAELPTTGAEGKLYLTPKAHTTSTATGNPIEATITAQAGQLESFQLDGDTFQQSYTGKNLFNEDNANVLVAYIDAVVSTITANSQNRLIWIPCEPNTAYTVSRQRTSGGQKQLAYTTQEPAVGVQVYGKVNWVADSTECTITTGEDAKYLVVRIWQEVQESDISLDDLLKLVQIEKSSSATSYEPYVGGQPSPNPEYPQPIQTVTGEQTVTVMGKNIINATILQNAWSNNDGVSIVYSSQYVRTVEYTPVDASTTYTLSYLVRGSVVMRGNILQYDSNKSFISSISIADNTTFATTSNTAFVRFNLYHPDGLVPNDITNLQLELGSTATDYIPFSSTDYPISLGDIELCKLGTYQDYIYKDGDSWKVHKKCKTITLDGSEDWQYSSNYSFFYAGVMTGMEIPVNAGVACYCRTHKGLTSSSSGPDFATEASGYSYAADVHTTQALVRIKDTRFSSAQDFANWLTQNNTAIYYVVKSATDTTITDTTLIAQLEAIRTASLENGTNTITNTATGSNLAGDMEVGYYEYDPTNRYDKWLWLDLNNNYEQIGGE